MEFEVVPDRPRVLIVTPQPFYEDRGTPIAVQYLARRGPIMLRRVLLIVELLRHETVGLVFDDVAGLGDRALHLRIFVREQIAQEIKGAHALENPAVVGESHSEATRLTSSQRFSNQLTRAGLHSR